MEAALKALAEPNRREILELVREHELSAGEVAEHFALTRPAVSQHLTVLKEAGLLEERRDGVRRLYSVRSAGLGDLRSFLQGFWDDRLTRLRDAAEWEEAAAGTSVEHVSVERETAIAATPATVWRLLTDPRRATTWMGVRASFDPRPGGTYRVEVIPGAIASGVFVDVDPPRRLVITWGWEGGRGSVPAGSTTVIFELIPRGGGTVLRLVHRDLPTVEATATHSQGWSHYIGRLEAVAAGRDPGRDGWIDDPPPFAKESTRERKIR